LTLKLINRPYSDSDREAFCEICHLCVVRRHNQDVIDARISEMAWQVRNCDDS
jgi:hypothetical protein